MKGRNKFLCLLLIIAVIFTMNVVEVKAYDKSSNFDNYIVKKDTDTDEDGIPTIDLGDLSSGDKKEYVVDCDDWTDFHSFWNVLRLAGPFVYIIFASFDFFKIVMAGDEEAIKKAKKQIPKRLIIFLLFILIPFFVQFIVKNFGTGYSKNVDVLKCVVNGG